MNIYREYILEHYKNPNNLGNLPNHNYKCHANNISCGDELEIKLRIDNKKIKDAKFTAKGCAISIASADILLDYLKNKDVNEIKRIDEKKLLSLLGTKLSPSRLNCALLSLQALKQIK
ncbi:MAG: iron-sulfur cluster assembly scaffold protein [Nanoarchaeota archaeon]